MFVSVFLVIMLTLILLNGAVHTLASVTRGQHCACGVHVCAVCACVCVCKIGNIRHVGCFSVLLCHL